MYCPGFFQTWHECQPCFRYSKTAIKRWSHCVVFALCARNSECYVFSLLRAKCSKLRQPSKSSYFMATTMNLTKTLSPFVCLGHNFSVKQPQVTRSWKNVEQWTVLTLFRPKLYKLECEGGLLQTSSQFLLLKTNVSLFELPQCTSLKSKPG